jgi:hypothetical protein
MPCAARFQSLHRPERPSLRSPCSGNVHDSAAAFIVDCIQRMCQAVPVINSEARLDSAFFSAEIVDMLDGAGVHFTLSVPFDRFRGLSP